jgi:hypothetical protein
VLVALGALGASVVELDVEEVGGAGVVALGGGVVVVVGVGVGLDAAVASLHCMFNERAAFTTANIFDDDHVSVAEVTFPNDMYFT